MELFDLSGKVAVVTGGSSGLGQGIALGLAEAGADIVSISYSESDETVKAVEALGRKAFQIKADLSDESILENVFNEALGFFGRVDILVNNAAVARDNLMVFMSDQEWKEVIATNLDSFFYVTRHLLQNMLAGKWGRIVNIVSLSGQKGLPGQVNYSASKGALIAATKSLAMEVGKKRVTVNAVAPGFIRTDMTKDLDEKQLSALVPLRRFGEPEEVAEVVSFLVSEGASYVTGETISVNGGMYS